MALHFDNLQELFILELREIYEAESRWADLLPRIAEAATNPSLRDLFKQHAQEVRREQREKLDQVFRLLNEQPNPLPGKAIQGFLDDTLALITADTKPAALDAALILAANKVKHYEIATYGTLCAFAGQMGLQDVKDILDRILADEKAFDTALTQLAEQVVNRRAQAS